MNGNGIWIFHASPAPVERADEWHDKVDVTSKAFLGLTVGCARCHDHKYDAIYTKDYYQMASIFASSRFKAYPQVPKAVVDEYEKQNKVLEKKNAALREVPRERLRPLRADAVLAERGLHDGGLEGRQPRRGPPSRASPRTTKVDPELLGALGALPQEEARQLHARSRRGRRWSRRQGQDRG